MAESTYKIKISADRVIGPIDLARVQAIVNKGRIEGSEPTSIAPFTEWKPFSSFPQLADLLLKKLEADKELLATKVDSSASAPASTSTNISSQPTRTMVDPNAGTDTPAANEPDEPWEMPTLLHIPMPGKKVTSEPDSEKTSINLPVPYDKKEVIESGAETKIISLQNVTEVLQKYVHTVPATQNTPEVLGGKKKRGLFGIGKVDEAEYVTGDGKRRLLSRNTAALLATGLLVMAYFASENDDKPKGPVDVFPRYHTFSYVEVNSPPPLGNPDPTASYNLAQKGLALMQKETPESYIKAIRILYTAVGKNEHNYDARGLLASAYIRAAEIVPRDEAFFNTVTKLLLPKAPKNFYSANYATALAEYYLMLERFDQADEAISDLIRTNPTAELYYQKAIIAWEKRDLNASIGFISKTLPPDNIPGNPRHLLFYADLLERKGQKEASKAIIKRIRKESPDYGPAVLFQADLAFRDAKYVDAQNILVPLVNHPSALNRIQLADTFILMAKVYESLKDYTHALRFANAAKNIHYDIEPIDDLIYRIKSEMTDSAGVYADIIQARKSEKSNQVDDAIRLYLKAHEANWSDPTADILLARVYVKQGQLLNAIDRYKKALDTHQHPVDAALELADIYIDRYDMKNALSTLSIAEERRLHKDTVQMLKGKIALRQNQKELAAAIFRKALSTGSRLTPLFLQIADIETEKTNRALAEFYYAMALRYDTLNSKALLGTALARFYLESPSRAIAFLKDKLAGQPNSAPIMTSLAVIYLSSGDQDSGKHYLQNAIHSDPHYSTAFKLLGNLAKQEGDRQNDPAARRHSYVYALASYGMYSNLAPNDPEGYKSSGDLYFNVGDFGAAAKNYDLVLKLAPNYPGINLRLAKISLNGEDPEGALKYLHKELEVNARNDDAYVMLGNINKIRKEYTDAINMYTKATSINDKNLEALFGLGQVYQLQGNYDNALSLYNRVVLLNPIDPLSSYSYFQMALIYQDQNNRPKAIQALANAKGLATNKVLLNNINQKLKQLNN